MRTIIVGFVALALLCISCASDSKVPRAKALPYAPTFPAEGLREPSLDGIWSQASIATLVEFAGPDLRVFRRAGQYCWEEQSTALRDTFLAFIPEYSLMSDGSSVTFRRAKRVGEFEMKPLEELPPACLTTPSLTDNFDIFVELMRERYPFFSRRGVVWATQSATVRRAFSSLESDEALLGAMSEALSGLQDPQLGIVTDKGRWMDPKAEPPITERLNAAFLSQDQIATRSEYAKAWARAVVGGLQRNYLSAATGSTGDDQVLWGLDENNVAYLRIGALDSLANTSWESTIGQLHKQLDEAQALILDVSMVRGHAEAGVPALVSWLLGPEQVAFKQKMHRTPAVEWESTFYKRRVPLWQKPVFVIISGVTQGGAERLVLALRNRPNIRLVGEQSSGSMAKVVQESLPNGWILEIPRNMYVDRDEVSFEGLGISPDFALELYPAGGLSRSHPLALHTLSDLIVEGHFE